MKSLLVALALLPTLAHADLTCVQKDLSGQRLTVKILDGDYAIVDSRLLHLELGGITSKNRVNFGIAITSFIKGDFSLVGIQNMNEDTSKTWTFSMTGVADKVPMICK